MNLSVHVVVCQCVGFISFFLSVAPSRPCKLNKCICASPCRALPLCLVLYPDMMRNPCVLASAVLLVAFISAVQASSHAMHAGSMIVPEFDEVCECVCVCVRHVEC